MTSPFYRSPEATLCQGDILACIPQIHLRAEPRLLHRVTLAGNRDGFETADAIRPEMSVATRTGVMVPADCDATQAILLTFDCEIDKDKYRSVALIRPIDPKWPESQQDIIRRNARFPFFHLPADPSYPGLPESYVDLRRLCTLSKEIVDSNRRIAALTETSRQALLLQFFRYFTRIDLKPRVFPAPG